MATSVVFQESPKGPRAETIKAMVDERVASQAAATAAAQSSATAETAATAAAQSADQGANSLMATQIARDAAQTARDAALAAKSGAELAKDGAEIAAENAQSAALTCVSWAVLSGLVGAFSGQGAEVVDTDTGTHTDPVVGGTANNAGRYSWSTSPAGWRRIGPTGLSGKVGVSDFNDLSLSVARGSESAPIGLIDGRPVVFAQLDVNGRLLAYQSDTLGAATAREYRMASSGNVAVNLDQTVVYIIAILGQSNGQAHNEGTGDTLVATSSIYPDHALMLRGGPRSGMRQTDLAKRAGRLVPAVESVNDIFRETRASSAATHLIRAVDDAVSFKPKVAVYVPAIGGQTYANLKRGRPSYTRFLNGLQDMATAIRAQGYRPVLLAVNWVGNESDLALDPAIIARNQLQSRRQIAEDVRRIIPDQVEDVIYVLDAVGRANSVYAPNTQTGAEMAAANDPHIILGSPCYQLTRAVGQEIHLDSLGQNNAGQALARVIMAEVFGTGWVPFTPRRVWRSGASEIKAIIPCPSGNLTLDTSGTVVDVAALPSGNYLGFVFSDGLSGASITGATISGNEVTFTLSSAPTGYSGTLVYATQRNVSESRDGPTYGARGALRSSVGEVNAYTGGTQYDWCLPFIRHFAL